MAHVERAGGRRNAPPLYVAIPRKLLITPPIAHRGSNDSARVPPFEWFVMSAVLIEARAMANDDRRTKQLAAGAAMGEAEIADDNRFNEDSAIVERLEQRNDRIVTRNRIRLMRANAAMLERLAQEIRITRVFNDPQTPSEACLMRVSPLGAITTPRPETRIQQGAGRSRRTAGGPRRETSFTGGRSMNDVIGFLIVTGTLLVALLSYAQLWGHSP
jgi:hypothetical protein